MRPKMLQMIDNRSVLEINWKRGATGWVVLDDRAHFSEDSSSAGSSNFSFRKASTTKKTCLDGKSSLEEKSIAGRRITQDVPTICFELSPAATRNWQAETRPKTFEFEITSTSCTTSDIHADIAEWGRKDGGLVDGLICLGEQISVTNISRVRELYFTRSPTF